MRPLAADERGFSLIEGVLASAVLAVGLLALAGMQAIALGRNIDANELTVVTNLAADIMERIHLNRHNVTAYHGIDTSQSATQPTDNAMARGDYAQWQTRLLQSGLRNPIGTVTVQPIGPLTPPLNQNDVTVRIRWRGSLNTDTSRSMERVVTFAAVVAPE